MNLEQQIRASVDGLDLALPAGLAQRAARGGRRRQYRHRAALSSVGLLSLTAGGYAVVRGTADHAKVTYASTTTTYVQNGVTFEVPKSLPLTSRDDRGFHFDDGDSVLTVRVTRYEIDPYFGPTPIMKDLGHGVLFRVSGTDDTVMQQIAATAADGYDGTRVVIDTLSVPVPDGFNVLQVTGPDTSASGAADPRRSTVHLCRRDATQKECLTITLNRVLHDSDHQVDGVDGDTTRRLADSTWTARGLRKANDRDYTVLEILGQGVDRSVVEDELSGTRYA